MVKGAICSIFLWRMAPFATDRTILAFEIEIRHYDPQVNLSSADFQYGILNLDLYYLKNETKEFHQTL